MSCPFKIYDNCCKLQIIKFKKYLGDNLIAETNSETNWEYLPEYDMCVGENKCPIMKENFKKKSFQINHQ